MSGAFRLAGLLRLRRTQEELAAADLARANAWREAAERRRRETAEMLAGSALPQIGEGLAWTAAVAGRAALGGMVMESRTALASADATAQAAARRWAAARTSATTLEKLQDRHAVALRAAEAHAEQLALDETAARRRPEHGIDLGISTTSPEGGR